MAHSRRIEQFIFTCIAVTLGITLALSIAEVTLRLVGAGRFPFLMVPDSRFGWIHPAKRSGWRFSDEFRSFLRTNSNGLMDREYAYEKAPGTFRILNLGNSFTEAVQVPQSKNFSKVLERTMNGRGTGRVEVINGGMTNYATDNEDLFFEREGAKYKPDLVLVIFTPPEDVWGNAYMAEWKDKDNAKPPKPFFSLEGDGLRLHEIQSISTFDNWWRRALMSRENVDRPHLFSSNWRGWLDDHFVVYRNYAILRHKLRLKRAIDVVQGEKTLPREMDVYLKPSSPVVDREWMLTGRIFQRLRDAVSRAGGQLGIVLLPDRNQIYPELWDKSYGALIDRSRVDFDLPNQRTATMAAKLGVPLLDLKRTFADSANDAAQPLYYPGDGHLTARGHALVARSIDEWLQKRGIYPNRKVAAQKG